MEEKIKELLTRGVEDVIVKENLEKKLKDGKPLRIKLGIDPTGKTIHIGRAITLRKLRAFQDLGHQLVLIVGDFTAQIGDASDKLEKRPMLDKETVKENFKNYKEIIGKIIDLENVEFVYNSKWLSKLGFQEIALLSESFSVQQMSARRNFKDRMDREEEVSVREFLYPLMQGYDSVAIKSDVEIGGFDQLFNLKAGRVIQKYYGMPEQDILTTEMLEGTDGRKMSTSWGNVINITDEANDMFGKIMSLHDSLILKYFKLCTDVSLQDIEEIERQINRGANPRDIKIKLAKEIVTIYHDAKKADEAEENFINTFSKGGIPEGISEDVINRFAMLDGLLLEKAIVKSKTEFKRLIDEGAISDMETGEKVTEYDFKIEKDTVFKIGKRRFLKVRVQ